MNRFPLRKGAYFLHELMKMVFPLAQGKNDSRGDPWSFPLLQLGKASYCSKRSGARQGSQEQEIFISQKQDFFFAGLEIDEI